MENKKAVIYARVSSTTERQNTERQVADLEALAKSKNLEIKNIFEEKYLGQRKTRKDQFYQNALNIVFRRR